MMSSPQNAPHTKTGEFLSHKAEILGDIGVEVGV